MYDDLGVAKAALGRAEANLGAKAPFHDTAYETRG
jgi:hypothetical protein